MKDTVPTALGLLLNRPLSDHSGLEAKWMVKYVSLKVKKNTKKVQINSKTDH